MSMLGYYIYLILINIHSMGIWGIMLDTRSARHNNHVGTEVLLTTIQDIVYELCKH